MRLHISKLLGGTLAFIGSIAPLSGQGHKPVVPLLPAEIIKYLPGAPADWKLTESTAKSFFVGWLCAQATREFQQPAPAVKQGAAQGPPYITRVRLMDTGYYPSFNGDFDKFRVGKYSNAESLVIAGMPARKITISPTRERLRVSVRGRFIAEVETDNQPPGSGQAWLQFFDFAKIMAIQDLGSSLPKAIPVSIVDELHPEKNSSSQVLWSGATPPPE